MVHINRDVGLQNGKLGYSYGDSIQLIGLYADLRWGVGPIPNSAGAFFFWALHATG
jgi:hypothetical protein